MICSASIDDRVSDDFNNWENKDIQIHFLACTGCLVEKGGMAQVCQKILMVQQNPMTTYPTCLLYRDLRILTLSKGQYSVHRVCTVSITVLMVDIGPRAYCVQQSASVHPQPKFLLCQISLIKPLF